MRPVILVAFVVAGCSDDTSNRGGGADAGVAENDSGSADATIGDGGGQAVLVFDNRSGDFVWTPEVEYEGDVITTGAYLDLTLSAGSQTGEVSPSGILFYLLEPSGLGTRGGIWFRSWRWYEPNDGGASFAAGEDFVLEADGNGEDLTITPVLDESPGDPVGPDNRWMAHADEYGDVLGVQAAHMQDPGDNTGPDQVWFTDGIVGVRFEADDGFHYGFVDLEFVPDPDDDLEGTRYSPVRWGYESQPETPLVIPP